MEIVGKGGCGGVGKDHGVDCACYCCRGGGVNGMLGQKRGDGSDFFDWFHVYFVLMAAHQVRKLGGFSTSCQGQIMTTMRGFHRSL